MVDVRNKKCCYINCDKRPNFGHPGQKQSLYCQKHKLEGMIDVKNQRCKFEHCDKHASYNFATETKKYSAQNIKRKI